MSWWHSFTVMTAETINAVVFQHKSQHLPMHITIPEQLRTQPWYTQPFVPNSNGLTLWGPKLAYTMHNDSVHTSKQCSMPPLELLICWSCIWKLSQDFSGRLWWPANNSFEPGWWQLYPCTCTSLPFLKTLTVWRVWRNLSSLKYTIVKLRLLSCNRYKPTHTLVCLDQTPIHTIHATANKTTLKVDRFLDTLLASSWYCMHCAQC